MVNYLKISERHAFENPKFAFKLYINIIVPNWVDFLTARSKERGGGRKFKAFEKGVSDMSIIP